MEQKNKKTFGQKVRRMALGLLVFVVVVGLSPFWGDLTSYIYVDRSSWAGDMLSYFGAEETGQTITDTWFQVKRASFEWTYGAMIALGGLVSATLWLWWKWLRWAGFVGMGIVAIGLLGLWWKFSYIYTPIEAVYENIFHPAINWLLPLF